MARRKPGWVPIQHGAWAFLVVPYVVGAVPAGLTWVQAPLFVFWVTGYLAYQAVVPWLKSHFSRRYLPAVTTYALASAACGVTTAVVAPRLLVWAPAFVPLIAIALVAAWKRTERSLVSGLATTAAACLMTLVAAAAGAHPDMAHALWCAAVALGYFAGTVLYIKTVIREKGKPGWYVASVTYHAVLAVAGAFVSPWVAGFFALMTLRAAVVPRLGWPVRRVGFGEVAASALLLGVLFLAHLPA